MREHDPPHFHAVYVEYNTGSDREVGQRKIMIVLRSDFTKMTYMYAIIKPISLID